METILTEIQNKYLLQPSDLTQLLETALSNKFLVIDGLDDCAETDRRAIYSVLNHILYYSKSSLKLILSSRDAHAAAFRLPNSLVKVYDALIDESTVATDVERYVVNELADRQQNGDFVLTDLTLVSQIQLALTSGAKGMFLWVALQMDEICHQDCDQDVRTAITSLPQTLEETYQRMLDRISKRQRSKRAREIFIWILAAKRPLTLGELREALAVEKHSNYSKPERLINDITQVMSWCEGFVVHDEVSGEVAFAHPTMKHSLLRHYAALPKDSFSLADADKEAGEICVTYLNFNDFKTQLIERSAGQAVTSTHVLNASVRTSDLGEKIMKPLQKFVMKSAPSHPNLGRLLQSQNSHQAGVARSRDEEHPFLRYAAEYWLPHSSGFEQTDQIWPIWHRLLSVEDEAGLIRRPWTVKEWAERDTALLSYIIENNHVAVLTAIQMSKIQLTVAQFDRILSDNPTVSTRLLTELCQNAESRESVGAKVYFFAQRSDDLKKLKRLLNAGADVNVQGGFYGNALQAACATRGGEETVRLLLNARADVNARGGHYETALQATCSHAEVSLTKLLLEAGADVNIQGGYYGTALHAVFGSPERDISEMLRLLLDAGADFNANPRPYGTVLQAACTSAVAPEVVTLLLNAGADVNIQGGEYGNALQTACVFSPKSGRKSLVKLLLDAGADVNAEGGPYGNALQAACVRSSDRQDVIKTLLDAGADVNVRGGEYGCPLAAAYKFGGREVVQLLRNAGAQLPLDMQEFGINPVS